MKNRKSSKKAIKILNSRKNRNLPTRYSPQEVEEKIYSLWEKSDYFRFKLEANSLGKDSIDKSFDQETPDSLSTHGDSPYSTLKNKKKFFSSLMPPPNVTGSLHIGHALNHTLQDLLIRWKRMLEYECLWFPGTDHAGIATQSVVEKELAKKGTYRKDLSLAEFQSILLDWKERNQKRIILQCKKIGDSCDWKHSLFTLDERSSTAVKKAFVDLYKKDWIYKDKALIHWSPKLGSALSDLEVEHREVRGHLWYIRYPLVDNVKKRSFGSRKINDTKVHLDQFKSLIIATTRPETLLGDTALAVHPEDQRYQHFVGKKVFLPLVGKEIPIIEDSAVTRDFGTGALKITPGHDFNDFEIGARNNLEQVNLLNKDGSLNNEAGIYKGLSILEARKKVVEDLKHQGYLVKVEPHIHRVGYCSRTGCVVEPLLSEQWFVRVKEMAKKALLAFEKGDIQFIPKMREKTFLHWMNNIEDWCISRQIWWGHRIPAWYCKNCNEIHVQEEEESPKACSQCGETSFEEEKDVLDTWFSSALWPLSTMDWPKNSILQKIFYPTDVLVTGYDIIFFWVARMMMMCIEFKKEIPFKTVYFHPLIRDSEGQKMSKSLGNVVDPLKLIENYGADALRFSLLIDLNPSRDIKFGTKKIEEARNFLNKIWNAYRFSLGALEDFNEKQSSVDSLSNPKFLSIGDEWILYRLGRAELKVHQALSCFEFSEAMQALRDFIWYEFCDWYLELTKPLLYRSRYGLKSKFRQTTQLVLAQILNRVVRLLHPFIPFITEELYQKIPFKKEACIIEDYPTVERDKKWLSQASTQGVLEFEIIKDVISAVRNIRGENRISPQKTVAIDLVLNHEQAIYDFLNKDQAVLQSKFDFLKNNQRGTQKSEAQRVGERGEKLKLNFKEIFSRNKGMIKILSKAHSFKIKKKVNLSQSAKTRILKGEGSIDVIVPLKNLVHFEEEIKRLNKSIEKLKTEENRISKKLSNQNFLQNAPEKVIEESQIQMQMVIKRIEDLKENLSRYQKKSQ